MLHRHRRTHAYVWTALAVLLPALIVAALVIRQNGPLERPAERLGAPAAATP